MPEQTSKLNLTVPNSIQVKLRELADALGINKTAALVMAVNEYHAVKVRPPQTPSAAPPPKP